MSHVSSLLSTHTFSLCAGLVIDYYDGGKDQVSTPPSAEMWRSLTRGKEDGCCYPHALMPARVIAISGPH